MEELSIGTPCWVQGQQGDWISGIVSQHQDGTVLVSCQGNAAPMAVKADACLLQNPQDAEDMTSLTHLHEPGVLYNLQSRYTQDKIYTLTGSILIAVNPFKVIPGLTDDTVMQQYHQQIDAAQQQQRLPPHVFGTAVSAYRQMMMDGAGQAILITGESGAGKTETCKLIMRCLAQLGRGKTDNGHAYQQQQPCQQSASVEQMVLESNPLLEAFGNAKTLRNNNSSRFGKYVEIQFSNHGRVLGAAIRTYLLERSRVVTVAPGERSFHVFYQMCAGASPKDRATWHLGHSTDYTVLNLSSCHQLPGVDEAEEYMNTRHAMASVGIDTDTQQQVFSVLAAILHLGNVRWAESASDHGVSTGGVVDGVVVGAPQPADDASQQALQWAAELLAVPYQQLHAALSTRTRHTPDGPITSPLTPAGADDSRNALCKVLYARLFAWLVSCINASLRRRRLNDNAHDQHANGHSTDNANGVDGMNGIPTQKVQSTTALMDMDGSDSQNQSKYTIGLLDIYGFESFETNDLEQLCINLANEKLQQHFNQHVFKWEQAEYIREGVDWREISYVDNVDVLDLVEGRLGLLDLLDEQCRFPTATAEDLAHKYSSTPSIANSKRFEKLRRPPTGFTIQHYAGPVRYATDNFLDKNKDFVVAEHATLLGSSTCTLVSQLFTDDSSKRVSSNGQALNGSHTPPPSSQSKSSFKFDSVTNQFKRQLADLMAALHVMQPHYVRCIKPSPSNRPGVFEPSYVLQQLRCGGVMEAVRISCAGYAYKQPFMSVLEYFYPLCPTALHRLRKQSSMARTHSTSQLQENGHAPPMSPRGKLAQSKTPVDASVLREAVQKLLDTTGVESYHLGHTKLFLKSSQAAALDKQRGIILSKAAVKIQAAWRGHHYRKEFLMLKSAAVLIQSRLRGWMARRLAERLRYEHAAITVQSWWRCKQAMQLAARRKAAIVAFQCALRVLTARRRILQRRREKAAILMQAAYRAYHDRLAYNQLVQQHRAAAVLQAAWRAYSDRHAYHEHQAAIMIQAAWRGYSERQAYHELLPKHKAATRIQNAWRASNRHSKLRAILKETVTRILHLSRAAVVMQTAWRATSARMSFAAMQKAKQKVRFQEQLKLFQAPPASDVAPKPLRSLPPATKQQLIGRPSMRRTAAGTADKDQQDVRAPKDVIREVESHIPAGTHADLEFRRATRAKEVSEVKEAARNARNIWQARIQQEQQLKSQRSSNLAGASFRRTTSSYGSAGMPGSPTNSTQSYGELLVPSELK